jgi:copper transport protein
VLRFDEPVTAGLGGVRVIGPTGERADQGALSSADGGRVLRRPVAATRRGTYTVAWRALSADGHTVEGSFTFHVGERTGAAAVPQGSEFGVEPAGWLGRWVGSIGALVTLGVLALGLLARSARSRLAGLAALGGAAVGVGALVELVAHTAEAAGVGLFDTGALLGRAVLDERTGALVAARGLGGVLVALSWTWRRAQESWLGAIACGAAVVVGAAALDGHAWSSEQRWVAVAGQVVHLGAAGAWAGGLASLLVLLRAGSAPVRAFSALALGCAGATVVTGVVSAIGQLSSLDDLWSSRYGRLVVAKTLSFGVLVGLGWWNRARIVPAIGAAVDAARAVTARRLGRTVRVELGVVLVVLGVTAALVATTPARSVVGAFTGSKVDGGIVLTLSVDPARPGANEIHGTFQALSGAIGDARVDAVEVQVARADIPARVVPVELVTADHFVARSVDLTAGRWTVTVTAVRRGIPTITSFDVRIP